MKRLTALLGFALFLCTLTLSIPYASADPMDFGITDWSRPDPLHCSIFEGNKCPHPTPNITNTTDEFFYDDGLVYVVANLTYQSNGTSYPGLNVTGNFSQVGGSGFVQAYDVGSGIYIFNETYVNYSFISSFMNIQEANITITADDGGGNTTNATAHLLLVNMSIPGCPPPDEVPTGGWPIAPGFNQTSWSAVAPTQAEGCTQDASLCNMTDTYGPGTWNGSAWVVCAPNFGGATTSFNTIASSGNFSAIPDFTLDIPGKVKMKFLMNVSFTSRESLQTIMEFGMRNLMGAGKIGINESEWDGSGTRPNFTMSAELTLYNVSGLLNITDPYIGYGSFNGSGVPGDLQTCPPTRCSGINWDGENLTFTVSSFSTYVVNNTLHNLTFQNLTVMENVVNTDDNVTYIVRITHWGNATQEEYNLSMSGIGTLNMSSITLNYSDYVDVEINISNSTPGLYSTYLIANHWNGSATETDWSLNSSDDNITLNTSFYPDFNVSKIEWNSTDSNHPFTGSNVTINATLNNIGSFNFSGNFNVSLYWDGSKISSETVINTSLGNGTSYTVIFEEVTSDSLVTNGLHTITVEADVLGNVNEYNETNNNRTLQLSIGYNVTIASISSSTLNASENITVSIYVNYTNGNPVDNLTVYNITLYDKYSGVTVFTWEDTDSNFSSSFDGSQNANGKYTFNITSYYIDPTTPSRPGVHNLSVTAQNGSYSGTSPGLDYYFLTVPDFSIDLGSTLVSSLQESTTDIFTVYVKNIGNSTAYDVKVYVISQSYVSISSTAECKKNLTSGSRQSFCSPTLTASAVSDNLVGEFVLRVSGTSSNKTFNVTSSPIYITVTDSATGDGTPGGATTGGCTTDAECLTGYYCSGGVCYLKQYGISITSYPSSLEANWSSYAVGEVTVKNTGQQTMTAKLIVTLDGMNVTVLPASMSLDSSNAVVFTVNISVPETAVLGDHSGTFKAYVNEDTGVYQTKSFTFTVLCTEKKKKAVNDTYHNYSAILEDLKQRFDRLKAIGFINESNLTVVESLLNITIVSINNIKDALDDEDYELADILLESMNTSINNLKSDIEDLELQQQEGMGIESGIWLWVVIGVVVVIVAGFLIYLLMPSFKGYHPGHGYKPVIKESMFEKMGKRFSRKKKKIKEPEKPRDFRSAYQEGYEKVSPGYRYERGTLSKLREKLKRKKKQKEVSEFFGSG